MTRLIAITGGIGSGKSIISQILSLLGYMVYDCDSNAKELMNSSFAIKNALQSTFGYDIVSTNGEINRTKLSNIVFNNIEKLNLLNSIVHKHVKEDLLLWKERNSSHELLFVETAILYQSGLDKFVDDIWEVSAPNDIKINRVIRRNNLSRQDVLSRIDAQKLDISSPRHHQIVINDDKTPIVPQIQSLLANKVD